MRNLPEYTVVIPSYNHEKYIGSAILSAVTQTHSPQSVIVIDDGSTDDTTKIVESMMQTYSIIQLYKQENLGAHAAINRGLKLANTDFLSILNSDDVYDRRRFEVLLSQMMSSQDIDLIGSDIEFIDSDGGLLEETTWFRRAKEYHREVRDDLSALINANYFMTTSNFLFRSKLLLEIGYFNDWRYCHDLDFLLRLVVLKGNCLFVSEKLLFYRFHGSNTIAEGVLRVQKEMWLVIFANLRFLSKVKRVSYFFRALRMSFKNQSRRAFGEALMENLLR